MKSFNTGMRIGKIGRRASVFPFGDVLERHPCGENDVAIVDVGGGRGQALETIREDCPTIKGRMILQDLPNVIEDALTKGMPPFIEIIPGSFFEKQSVKGKTELPGKHLCNEDSTLIQSLGARIYHFRRIFHCWNTEKSREILENTKEAMDDLSRVVIADMVLPDIGCPQDLAMQDLNMMSLGGMERSVSDWRQLLESAGLVLRKIWQNDEGPKHAIVEAVLPSFRAA